MFDVTCQTCGAVLIGFGRITAIEPTPAGMAVAFVCTCGRHGRELVPRAGRRARPRDLAPVTT